MSLGGREALRRRVAVVLGACLTGLVLGLLACLPDPAEARGDRTLRIQFTHTGERGEFTYRRNGRYDQRELARLNQIMRDWRRDEATQMDPELFDLLWEIQRRTGSNGYIHIVSAYRSPATNENLRRRGRGVAQRSQHTAGRAIDFYIPGVSPSQLRAIAFQLEGGGVGFYPGSGFVHVDTGNVRSWPRMPRQQLLALFPDGKTLHIPSDGKPLPGHQQALAERDSRRAATRVASLDPRSARAEREGPTVAAWLGRVFKGGGQDDRARERPAPAAPTRVAARATPPAAEAQAAARPEPRPQPQLASAQAEAQPLVPASPPAARPPAAAAQAAPAPEPEVSAETTEVAAPLPRPAPGKTRLILLAARDRAMALASAEPPADDGPPAPLLAAAPQPRPAREAPEIAAVDTADAALAALYATAAGRNPEETGAKLMTAALTRPAEAEADQAETGPTVRMAYAPAAAAEAYDAALAGAMAMRAAQVRQAHGATGSTRVVSGLVSVPLDHDGLRRLMSQQTTRMAGFAILVRPQPRPDFYTIPADRQEALALALAGEARLRTDRFGPVNARVSRSQMRIAGRP